MSRKTVFLILTVLGFIAPYYFFFQVRSFDLNQLLQQFSDSRMLSGIATDLLVSVIVFWFYMFTEANKLQMKNAWVSFSCNIACWTFVRFTVIPVL